MNDATGDNAADGLPSDAELDDTRAMEIEDDPDQELFDDGTPDPDARDGGRRFSTATLLLGMLAAALVAGVVGVIIGWKVEQQRVKDDLANVRPIGTVDAVEDDSVTVNLSSASGIRTYEVTEATVVDGESGGGTAGLSEGDTVLVKSEKSGGDFEAIEIVVLPEGTTYGRG